MLARFYLAIGSLKIKINGKATKQITKIFNPIVGKIKTDHNTATTIESKAITFARLGMLRVVCQ